MGKRGMKKQKSSNGEEEEKMPRTIRKNHSNVEMTEKREKML